MQNIKMKLRSSIKAFTLLEGLLTLFLISFMLLCLSLPVSDSYARVEEHLFFMRFEQAYRHLQKLSILRQKEHVLVLKPHYIKAEEAILPLPKQVKLKSTQTLTIDKLGGNHSLARVVFENRDRQITYQFYLGSGNYQKTSQSLHRS